MSNKERAKDQHNDHVNYEEGLSDDMKAFLSELRKVQGGKFSGIRLTSGLRVKKEGQKDSHHHTGNAIDIAARGEGGSLGQEAYEYLLNNEEGLKLMSTYGLGIIDETDPQNMKKYGSTGPHFHIGKDSYYANITNDRMGQFASGKLIFVRSFSAQQPEFDYNNIDESYNNLVTTGYSTPDPFNVISGSPERTFLHDLNKAKEKEDKKDEKISESDARSNIEKMKAEKLKAEQERKAAFIQALTEINKPLDTETPKKQHAFQEEEFNPIIPEMSMGNLPSIFTLPQFNDGGTQGYGEPEVKNPKQVRDEQYFAILNQLRGTYKHLDPNSQQWTSGEGVFDFGSGPVKKLDPKGWVPVTTEDYKTWKVGSATFEPTEFIDTGITGLDRTSFEDTFKKNNPELVDSDDYSSQFKTAWDEAYAKDHVALAVKEDKYGRRVIPVGTGQSSQKFAEDFGKDYASFYTKNDRYFPYYSWNEEKAKSKTQQKELAERQQRYTQWRQALLEEKAGEFSSGTTQQQKYGGLFFKYPHGGEHETAVVSKDGTVKNRYTTTPFGIDYQQTGPQQATWSLPSSATSEEKSQEKFVRDTFNMYGEVPKQHTLEFEEVFAYPTDELRNKQSQLMAQYEQSFKKLWQYGEHSGVGLPKSNRIQDLEAWNKSANEKVKEIDKRVSKVKGDVEKLQQKLGYDNPQDVLSEQGLKDLRNLYKDKKITNGEFRDAYENYLKTFDPNLVSLSVEDQKKLESIWKGPTDEKGRRKWMDDPMNVSKVAATVGYGAALSPAFIPGAAFGNPIGSAMALMDKPIIAGLSANNMLAPYYTYKTVESSVNFAKDPSLSNAGEVAWWGIGVPGMWRGTGPSNLINKARVNKRFTPKLEGGNISGVGENSEVAKELLTDLIEPEKAGFTFSLNPLSYMGQKLPKNAYWRKMGNSKGMESMIESKGIVSPSKNHLFFSRGNKPMEDYKGIYATSYDPSKGEAIENFTRFHGPRGEHKGLSPIVNGASMRNIPISDPGIQVWRRLPFSNAYTAVDKQKILSGDYTPIMKAMDITQDGAEKVFKAALWGSLGQSVGNSMYSTDDNPTPFGKPILSHLFNISTSGADSNGR